MSGGRGKRSLPEEVRAMEGLDHTAPLFHCAMYEHSYWKRSNPSH